MIATRGSILRAFARDCRGSAAVECAVGAFVLVTSAALCFDLYARIEADTAGARMAGAMADYVSRDPAPSAGELAGLGDFLRLHELAVPANLVYVLTAVRQPPAPAVDPDVLWVDDTLRFGEPAVTQALAGACARHAGDGIHADLPDDFTMVPGEVLIIAEVCARLTRQGSLTGRFVTGDVYRLHALPARDPHQPPARPA